MFPSVSLPVGARFNARHAVTVLICVWFGCPVLAQSLPRLKITAASNHLATVVWPHTSAGFTLQESEVLPSMTNWESSALSPTFDSNRAQFSVSVPVTNAAEFFRLKQQADLRGIYVDSNAFPLDKANTRNLTASLSVPGVDGLVLVLGWSTLEPSYGEYNWTNLDFWISRAMAANLKVDLSLRAGDLTPSWLFDSPTNGGAGATPLTFSFAPKDGQSTNCEMETIAAPWDTHFLAAWDDMLNAVSTHLTTNGAYEAVKLLRLTAINRNSDELHLPAQTAKSTGLACVSNAPAIWQKAGYTPSNLLAGWSNILASFQRHFPDKSFSVAIIALTNVNAFPPIDDHGAITNVAPEDQNWPLLALASDMFGGRLVIQNNSLYPSRPAQPQTVNAARGLGTLIAFQTNENGPGESADCSGTCADATFLAMLRTGIYPLNPTNSLRAQYIEVFAADVITFTNAIWQAHRELLGGP